MKNYNKEYKNEENTINSIKEENQGWIDIIFSENIDYILSIIDDAECNLFEFKVENHKIYFREIE